MVSCIASGKPRPHVSWWKDDKELTADVANLYKVVTTTSEGNIKTVNSTLSFLGHARPQTDQIIASDRGKYKCVFKNEVKTVESEMMLKIEHGPIVLHKHDKVAASHHEDAEITCQVQAWPKSEFQWSYGNSGTHLQGSSSDGHYEISSTSDNDDIYTSILKIRNIIDSDYGNYHCKAYNVLNETVSIIRLQPKGPPEKPTEVTAINVGPTHVALGWTVGFDGGIPITKYFVSYRRISSGEETVAPDCVTTGGPVGQWLELDCRRSNPCNITNLEQHQTYSFKVKAINTNNHSNYSDEVTAATGVAKIPTPLRVTYDPESRNLAINVGATCLALVASIEKFEFGSNDRGKIIDDWPLEVLGSAPTQRESRLSDMENIGSDTRIRVRLCLQSNRQKCGEYAEAKSELYFFSVY